MAAQHPLPLRILVKGASLMHAMSEREPVRDDFLFSRALEEALLEAGRPSTVWTAAVASQPMRLAFPDWEEQVMAWSPDVVVLSYGYYECIHAILPRVLERHVNSNKTRPGPVRELYRRLVLRPLWRTLAQLQCRVDQRIGSPQFGRVKRRFRTDLTEFVRRTRAVASPLVILMEFLPPGARGQSWFPGMAGRVEEMNEVLREVVAGFASPDVLLLPVPEIAARHVPAGTEPNPDGFHYTPALHTHIGQAIAEEVLAWLPGHPRVSGQTGVLPQSVPESSAG